MARPCAQASGYGPGCCPGFFRTARARAIRWWSAWSGACATGYPRLRALNGGKRQGMPATFQAHRHAVVVDRNGRRFVSEYDYNIGEAIDRRDPATGGPLHLPCWLIADRRFLRAALMFHW